MTQPEVNRETVDRRSHEACWRSVGVEGDRSCPKLSDAGHCRDCPVYSEAGLKLFERESPPEYVDESTRQLATPEAPHTGEAISVLVFRVGPEWLAIAAGRVVEVVSPRRIHRIPHRTNRLLLGLANIRGELELCASLHELLGIEGAADVKASEAGTTSTAKSQMIVVEQDQNRWVIPVDEVEGVQWLPVAALEKLPYTVQRSSRYFCESLFYHGHEKVGVLSAARVFASLEKIAQ
jgi:chemotaxis-related protein WspD